PPTLPMRKIMRRQGDKSISGTNTASNSEGPSKTTSEAGGDSGSDGGQGTSNDSKSKAAQSMEERQARYREARLRIFGTSEESELPTTPDPQEDISRSSSTSGKKRNS